MARQPRSGSPIGKTEPEAWPTAYGVTLYPNLQYEFLAGPGGGLLVAFDVTMPTLKRSALTIAKQTSLLAKRVRDAKLSGVRKRNLSDLLAFFGYDTSRDVAAAPPLPSVSQPGPVYAQRLEAIANALRATDIATSEWEDVVAAMSDNTLTPWRGNIETDQVRRLAEVLNLTYRGPKRSHEAFLDDVVTVCERYGVHLSGEDRAGQRKSVATILAANPRSPRPPTVKSRRRRTLQKSRSRRT